MAKPHIAKLVTTGRWCCSMRKTEPGFGISPREAFRDWKLQNCGRHIDIGRYAGTYGGAHQDQEAVIDKVANVTNLAAFIPRMIAAFVVLIALAIAVIWFIWR